MKKKPITPAYLPAILAEKVLHNGQQIKTAHWKFEPKVTVWTLEGDTRKDCARQKLNESQTELAVQERFAIELKRCMRQGCVPLVCGALHAGTMICSDYPGKAAAMAAESEAYKNAVEVKDGEVVNIEGLRYFVRVVDRGEYVRHSDPIFFEVIPEYPDYN